MADSDSKHDETLPDGQAPGPWDGNAVRETWHLPQSAWWLYLLSVLTFGLWLCHWAGCVADDLRRNRGAAVRPCAVRFGLLVPGFGWRLLRELARAVHALGDPATGSGPRFVALVALAGGTIQLLYLSTLLTALLAIFWPELAVYYPGYLALGSLLLLPLPFLVLQLRLNRFKATLAEPGWVTRSYPLVYDLALAGLVIAAAVRVVWPDLWQQICSPVAWTDQGEERPLVASVPVRGESGLYSLTPPDDDWARVDPDRFHAGSDLSLVGPGRETRVFVWTDCDGESVEDRVSFRRGKYTAADRAVRIEERRELLDEPFVPVSYARYRKVREGEPELSFIATIAHGDVLVEVIGRTGSVELVGGSLEALVRSLRLKQKATSCDAP